MSASILANLEKLIGTPRDGALLRFSIGNEYLKSGEAGKAAEQFREAVTRDPKYSAAWKLLGKAHLGLKDFASARQAWEQGLEAARVHGDKQAEKEMTVFLKKLERQAH